jgi:thiamine-monophosphate kinase
MARRGEFQLIKELFAPLADQAHALGLTDDAALVSPDPGHVLVATTDMVVAGVHFLADDPPADVARKALRVNLSDVAAMGAKPLYYLQTLAIPASTTDSWLESYAGGLRADQAKFQVILVGGDTVATPGPLAINIVALGQVRAGMAIRRSGARPGDTVFVSGTIGDAALGLRVAQRRLEALDAAAAARLEARYRIPQPRTSLGPRLVGLANAAIDVSDGLIADLGHIAEESGVAISIEAGRVPLSVDARHLLDRDPTLLATIVTGGDDYELAFTAPVEAAAWIARLGTELAIPLSPIGRVRDGAGVEIVGADGKPLALGRGGHEHF